MKKTTWVVVADEAIARILELPQKGGDLQPVEELTDPDAHARERDLRNAPLGRRAGGGEGRGGGRAPHHLMPASNATASAGESELHLEGEEFARRVAQRLTELHQQQRFDELRIVAAPRFLGYLRKALGPEVSRAVVGELNKELIHLNNQELTKRVFEDADGAAR
jgi:protein required for attachment to host cells